MSNFGLFGFPQSGSLSDNASATSPSNTSLSVGIAQVLTGEKITKNDLLQIEGVNGKALKVATTDYAAISTMSYGTAQTSTATGMILAQTVVVASQTTPNKRQSVLRDTADGSIYTLTDDTNSLGVKLNRYSATGAIVRTVTITPSALWYNNDLIQLDNGNLVAFASTGTQLNYAVYDSNLSVVKAWASIGEATILSYSKFAVCALAGVGFAVVHQPNNSPLLSNLATFDYAGVALLAPTTIWTRTGTSSNQNHAIAQLSNGNLVLAVSSSNTVSTIGLYYAVVSTSGALVKAFTNLDTDNKYSQELSVINGYFCIARTNDTNLLAAIFDNSGTLQGSVFSAATTQVNIKLVADGAHFWLLWGRSSDANEMLTKLPTTGSNYTTTIITLSTTQYGSYIDAFYENGLIVAVSQSVTLALKLWVISTDTGKLVSNSDTVFGVAPVTNNGTTARVIPGGDCSFICLYDYSGTNGTLLCIGKYANTAIIGVADSNAAINSMVSVKFDGGAYAINRVIGSPVKAFDMSATSQLYGNKGSIQLSSVILKGM